MQAPQFLLDLLQLLLDLAVPAAFCTLAAAGVSLRHEGGINFHVNGRTGKWILWTIVLLTLPQLLSWVLSWTRLLLGIRVERENGMKPKLGQMIRQRPGWEIALSPIPCVSLAIEEMRAGPRPYWRCGSI
jgi:hypothetical protein